MPVWLGITLLAFLLSRLAPGDPARAAFIRTQGRPPSAAELAAARERLGLDEPLIDQYLDWLGAAVTGDLGVSTSTGAPVTQELLQRFPATLEITVAATVVAVAVAVPVGVLAAMRRNSLLDQVTRGGSMLAASTPSFWLAFLLIIVFSVQLELLPASGRGGLEHLILPALALGIGEAAILARLTRSSLLEVLGEDYVTAARAKGLPERAVIARHAMRNAMTAVVTEIGLIFGFLLAYSAIIEVIFVWPGIGRFLVDAIGQRDYAVIQGFVVFAGTLFLLINLAVDLVYAWLDPRVSLDGDTRQAAV